MLRPLHDWILVKLDPIEQFEGSIFLPLGQVTRTATVLLVGPGRRTESGDRIPVAVAPGETVVFRREHLEHKQGKQIVSVLQELGDDLGLLRAPDILYVVDGQKDFEDRPRYLRRMQRIADHLLTKKTCQPVPFVPPEGRGVARDEAGNPIGANVRPASQAPPAPRRPYVVRKTHTPIAHVQPVGEKRGLAARPDYTMTEEDEKTAQAMVNLLELLPDPTPPTFVDGVQIWITKVANILTVYIGDVSNCIQISEQELDRFTHKEGGVTAEIERRVRHYIAENKEKVT